MNLTFSWECNDTPFLKMSKTYILHNNNAEKLLLSKPQNSIKKWTIVTYNGEQNNYFEK